MKNIAVGMLVLAGLAFAGGAAAASVGKGIIQGKLWGYIDNTSDALIYRIADTETKAVCYVAYYEGNTQPDMECVK